jgi:sacsin
MMSGGKKDVATGIADTLDRYTVESTFKEYLTDADDCQSAKELSWLLNEGSHAKRNLLIKKLQDY